MTTQTLSPALQISSASTWRSRLRALGPGVLMASAAIGGSHLVASTQAGALYGWQLALIIVLTNLFKYPFFRFSAHYTLDSGKSLIEGYAEKSRAYLWVFLVMCFLSSTISAAAVALLTAVIVQTALPGLPLSVNMWSVLLIASCVFILFMGRYKALDTLSKIIVVSLSITTVIAAGIAASKGMQMQTDFVEPSPWTLAALPFICTTSPLPYCTNAPRARKNSASTALVIKPTLKSNMPSR